MNVDAIQQNLSNEKSAIEKAYGAWTAHNLSLGDGVYTIKNEVVGDEVKLRRVVQIVADVCERPIRDLRILDLACLEGMYALEFSRQGARVCGIEGREANIQKARYAARYLSLQGAEFHQDDVRNLSVGKYGAFDVVLCLGILYHLDSPDIFNFVEQISSVCRRVAIIDTATSLYPEETFLYKGKKYAGRTVREHAMNASADDRKRNLWASLDNPSAVHPTKVSLYRLLYDVGFTSVYECHIPHEPEKPTERVTLVAIKGTPVPLLCCPQLPTGFARDLVEESSPAALRHGFKIVSKCFPGRFKHALRQLLFSTTSK